MKSHITKEHQVKITWGYGGILKSSWKENHFIQTTDGLGLTKMPPAKQVTSVRQHLSVFARNNARKFALDYFSKIWFSGRFHLYTFVLAFPLLSGSNLSAPPDISSLTKHSNLSRESLNVLQSLRKSSLEKMTPKHSQRCPSSFYLGYFYTQTSLGVLNILPRRVPKPFISLSQIESPSVSENLSQKQAANGRCATEMYFPSPLSNHLASFSLSHSFPSFCLRFYLFYSPTPSFLKYIQGL